MLVIRKYRSYETQCWFFAAASLATSGGLAWIVASMYAARKARGEAFFRIWAEDQSFYESLGYHPPFGQATPMWIAMVTVLVLAAVVCLVATCCFIVSAFRLKKAK